MTSPTLPLVTIDDRGRVGLKKFMDAGHVLVQQHDNGSVTLIPATVTPTALARALADDPTLLERIADQGSPSQERIDSPTWKKIKADRRKKDQH